MSKKDLVLSGLALRGLVRAAETPVSGELVKKQLFTDLDLDSVLAIDLRAEDPAPASLPIHPAPEDD